MNYLKKSFSVGALPTEKYRNEWDRIFRRSKEVDEHGICDHCKKPDVDLYLRNRLYLCITCVGRPPTVPEFWTCSDCGGTAAWGEEQLHRCKR